MTAVPATIDYSVSAELPDIQITWLDQDGDLIDFSSDYGFVGLIGRDGQQARLTKVTGFTGLNVIPNLIVQFTPDELLALRMHTTYMLQITATRTSDGKSRVPLRVKFRMSNDVLP